MKVAVMPIVVGARGTSPQKISNRTENLEISELEMIQTTAPLRSARILRRVLET